jgi:hypothetical protein
MGATCPNDIEITIARLGDDAKPRNYSHGYEEREDTSGGFKARLWAHKWGTEPARTILGTHGPSISGGDLVDYERAVKGMKRVDRKIAAMAPARGSIVDAADGLGRWLEACGVTEVYYRPEGAREHQWLTDGEWRVETVGVFLARVRSAMPENAKPLASVEGGVV